MAWARKQYHNDTDETALQLIVLQLITGKDIIVHYEMFSVRRISKPKTSLQ